jgi:hypothetical protein
VDAFSSKYKSAFSLRAFDKAVRQYRQKRISVSAVPTLQVTDSVLAGMGPYITTPKGSVSSSQLPGVEETASQHSRNAREHLEMLPTEILEQARDLEERVQYFATLRPGGGKPDNEPETPVRVPPSLQKLMDDISHAEGVTERIREEVFKDEEARQVRSFFPLLGTRRLILSYRRTDTFHVERRG